MSPIRLDEVGYWSEIKLDIVREYAKAYSTILNKKTDIKAHLARRHGGIRFAAANQYEPGPVVEL